jgi:4'-phosphopantetheinyl transferase
MVTKQTLYDLEADSIHIWRIDLNGPIDALAELLSPEELSKADAKLKTNERERSIRARGGMRSILGNYLGVSGDSLVFNQGEKGKPSISQSNSAIEFNLTHCEDLALLAVAKTVPVGIDLERIRTSPSQLRIAQRVFSDQVYKELEQLPSSKLDKAFFHYWTELEACIKCLGNGIFSNECKPNGVTSTHFSPQDGWIACIAAKDRDITSLKLKQFVYMY